MRSKLLLTLKSLFVLLGILALQACFEERPYAVQPGYVAPAYGGYVWPGYAYGPPAYTYGDYDEHHHWHDRDWWVDNRRDWVQHHHPDWAASRGRRDHDHDRD